MSNAWSSLWSCKRPSSARRCPPWEGPIDHQLLGLHHVHPGAGELAWDVGFLLFGALLAAAGWALIRAGRSDEAPRGAP
jgi:uncharacterized membrane protein